MKKALITVSLAVVLVFSMCVSVFAATTGSLKISYYNFETVTDENGHTVASAVATNNGTWHFVGAFIPEMQKNADYVDPAKYSFILNFETDMNGDIDNGRVFQGDITLKSENNSKLASTNPWKTNSEKAYWVFASGSKITFDNMYLWSNHSSAPSMALFRVKDGANAYFINGSSVTGFVYNKQACSGIVEAGGVLNMDRSSTLDPIYLYAGATINFVGDNTNTKYIVNGQEINGYTYVAKEDGFVTVESACIEHTVFEEIVYNNGIFANGSKVASCTADGCDYCVTTEALPIFIDLGYTVATYGTGSVMQGFAVNEQALSDYNEANKDKQIADFGVVAGTALALGETNDVFDEKGELVTEKLAQKSFYGQGFTIFEMKLSGFNASANINGVETSLETIEFYNCGYYLVKNGDTYESYYMNENAVTETLPNAVTFESVK